MKEKKIFLGVGKVAMKVLIFVMMVAVIGLAGDRRGIAKEAQAAGEAKTGSKTQAKKNVVEFQLAKLYQPLGIQSSGNLLTAATHKVIEEYGETTSEEEKEVYDVISTSALAQSAMQYLEQETLELMASPAGTAWGGMIKVYAGDTPLLITEEDKEVLLRIVEAEATCEDVKGRMLVANVILNRVVSKKFPNSIAEVVFQNNGVTYQFAPIKDGRYWTVKVSDETREAVERVLAGEDYSQGAMYFAARRLANKKAMSWFDSSLEFLFQHGVH